jgi:hypothetical protein
VSSSDAREVREALVALGPTTPLPARARDYAGGAQIAARLEALEQRGARIEIAGRSRRGGAVLAVTIGEGTAVSAILAGVHPIVWIGVEVGLALLERLAADPPRDRRIVAFPLVNVDGYRAVEADLRRGVRWWRRGNAAGVDLNRNFPAHWRAGGSGGRAAIDQPEVAAVVRTLRPLQVERAVSLHSIGKKLLLPWGGRFARPARWPALHAAALAIQARLPDRYTISQVSRWLPGAFAHGLELDWLYGDLGALAVLVECSYGGASLGSPSTWLDPFRWYNPIDPARHADAIAAAVEPFLRGEA